LHATKIRNIKCTTKFIFNFSPFFQLFFDLFSFFPHLYSMERLRLKQADEIRRQILAYMASDDAEIQYLIRLNAMLLLTMENGPSAIQIADLYGLARQTVTRWAARLNKSETVDIDVLRDAPKPGRATRMSEKQIALVDKALSQSPRKAGIAKDQWSGAVLSGYLQQKYKIELTTRMCQRWIRRLEDKRLKTPRR
jgi:transposase